MSPRRSFGLTLAAAALLALVTTWPRVDASYIPTPIKSIQQVTITSAGSNSNTYTLSPTVTKANSILIWNGSSSVDSSSGFVSCDTFQMGEFTDNATITARLGGSAATCASTGAIYQATVVEFVGQFVKSSGCGNITIADGSSSNSATIGAVVVAKTIVHMTGFGQLSAAPMTYAGMVGNNVSTQLGYRLTIPDTTHITATGTTLSSPTGNRRIGYCYLEFR
jgi:hypothetical protein